MKALDLERAKDVLRATISLRRWWWPFSVVTKTFVADGRVWTRYGERICRVWIDETRQRDCGFDQSWEIDEAVSAYERLEYAISTLEDGYDLAIDDRRPNETRH